MYTSVLYAYKNSWLSQQSHYTNTDANTKALFLLISYKKFLPTHHFWIKTLKTTSVSLKHSGECSKKSYKENTQSLYSGNGFH